MELEGTGTKPEDAAGLTTAYEQGKEEHPVAESLKGMRMFMMKQKNRMQGQAAAVQRGTNTAAKMLEEMAVCEKMMWDSKELEKLPVKFKQAQGHPHRITEIDNGLKAQADKHLPYRGEQIRGLAPQHE